jgi:hypothetical protein
MPRVALARAAEHLPTRQELVGKALQVDSDAQKYGKPLVTDAYAGLTPYCFWRKKFM